MFPQQRGNIVNIVILHIRHVNSTGRAKAWESITQTQVPTPKCGSAW